MTTPTIGLDDAQAVDVDLLRIYRDMVRCRAFEDQFVALVDEGHTIVGWHPCKGEESLCAIYSQLRDDDYCGYTHRVFYPWITKGIDPVSLFAEGCGRAAGTSKGKGGTHISDFRRGVLGRAGMQGGHFPLFVGTAIAAQLRGTDQISVVTTGEGCATSGLLHEAANHAAVWKLPIVFVCHNNQYMQSIPAPLVWGQPDVSRIADAYGMPSRIVAGSDPVAVAAAGRWAIDRARTGEGPTFLELKTIRWGTHYLYEPDGLPYRDFDAIDESQREADPVHVLADHLTAAGLADDVWLRSVEDAAREEMRRAAEEAVRSPLPDESEAFSDIFSGWTNGGQHGA